MVAKVYGHLAVGSGRLTGVVPVDENRVKQVRLLDGQVVEIDGA